jgi:hypothetical protein
LSILKQKINKREYLSFEDFVRDCALVGTPVVMSKRRKQALTARPDHTQCANIQPTGITSLQ